MSRVIIKEYGFELVLKPFIDDVNIVAEVIYTDIIFQKNSEKDYVSIGRSFSFGDWNEYNIAGYSAPNSC